MSYNTNPLESIHSCAKEEWKVQEINRFECLLPDSSHFISFPIRHLVANLVEDHPQRKDNAEVSNEREGGELF